GDRAAEGAAVPYAADDGHDVLFELHARAASVTEPTSTQRLGDVGGGHLHAGGQSLQYRDEFGAVRLACGQPAQHGDHYCMCRTVRLPRRTPKPGVSLLTAPPS